MRHYSYVVLGAGLSGLTTARELSRAKPGEVLVLEREDQPGGLCRTITRQGARYDLGSHRIHPSIPDNIARYLCDLSRTKWLINPRDGKLRLRRQYIGYPINSLGFLKGLGLLESAACALSLSWARLKSTLSPASANLCWNYETYLKRYAGARAYRLFYEPYARKVWGCEPSQITTEAVKKRISMTCPLEILRAIFRGGGNGHKYYYPPNGIGSLADALSSEVCDSGSTLVMRVADIRIQVEGSARWITYSDGTSRHTVSFDKLVTTIPLDDATALLDQGNALQSIRQAMRWGGLRVAYVHVRQQPLITGETSYFPELEYIFGRVSIPRRFSPAMQPDDTFTSFVCEIPCTEHDAVWQLSPGELGDRCLADLVKAGLLTCPQNLPGRDFVVNLPKVYPLYDLTWSDTVKRQLEYLNAQYPFVYASGRAGLFLHCNLDHSVRIGLEAARAVLDGVSSRDWHRHTNAFRELKLRD